MRTAAFVLVSVFLFACRKKATPVDSAGLQQQCVHRLSQVIVYDIFTPPVASRIYAYCNLAFYEAVRFEQNGSSSIAAKLKGFEPMPLPQQEKLYDFTLAAVHAFFKVATALCFSKDSLKKHEAQFLERFADTDAQKIYQNSLAFGDAVATVILKRASTDNYKKTRGMPKYSVFRERGKWQQTPPDYADAVEPNWSLITPLLLDSAGQCRLMAPLPHSLDTASEYFKEVREVYTVRKNLTQQQDTIAHYWDDNPFVTEHAGHFMYATKKTTPGGHWMGITGIVCRQAKVSTVKTARIYALVSCAMFDGFIACWEEKFRSRTVRPVTVIRESIDPTWEPLLQTPPFPEYPSGHSVVSAAAASVLTKNFNDHLAFRDTTELEYLGLKRSFNSIQQAADEAAISRLYGGIHFRAAIEQGKKQGRQVAALYNSLFN